MQRILVKEVNWLGDVVMSQPALRAVRRAYPEAFLSVLIKRELAGFFAGADWIDEVIPYRLRAGLAGVGDRLTLLRALRQRRFDTAILFPDSFDAALWPALARIPRRIGYRRDGRTALLTRAVPRGEDLLQGHQVHYRLRLLESALGIPVDPDDYAIDVGQAQRETIQQWLAARRQRPQAPLIALAPGAAFGPAKEWPAAHFAELIDALAQADGSECVLVGAPGERERCEQVATASFRGALIAAGETDIGQLIALLSLSDAFVGNDSGAMHVAGALGLPTIGIFGSTRPERTSPLGPHTRVVRHPIECSPCLRRTCRFGHYECLTQVQPDEVLRALRELRFPARPA